VESSPEACNARVTAALAGRRIDAPDTGLVQFPLICVPAVRGLLNNLLSNEKVSLLVCSAACGADLLALDTALNLGVRCRVVLPFDVETFRRTSVVDRPGDWGPLYDRIIGTVRATGDLIILPISSEGDTAYRLATETIVREATLTISDRNVAIVVWEGKARKEGDATADFQDMATKAGMSIRTVLTQCV
jgi:hypothetical protein